MRLEVGDCGVSKVQARDEETLARAGGKQKEGRINLRYGGEGREMWNNFQALV